MPHADRAEVILAFILFGILGVGVFGIVFWVLFFKVEGDGSYTIFELYELTTLNIIQSIYTGNTISHLKYSSHLLKLR